MHSVLGGLGKYGSSRCYPPLAKTYEKIAYLKKNTHTHTATLQCFVAPLYKGAITGNTDVIWAVNYLIVFTTICNVYITGDT